MSKIEPGCLALINRTGSRNYGKLVTVVEPYDGRKSARGRPIIPVGEPTWIVAAGNLLTNNEPIEPTPWVVARERYLRRIDNPGDEEADLLLAPLPQQDKVPA